MKHNHGTTGEHVTARQVDPGDTFDKFSQVLMGAVAANDTDEDLFRLAVAVVFGATFADVEGLAVHSAYMLAAAARDTHADNVGT